VKHREHLTTLLTSIIRLYTKKSPWKLDFQGLCLQSAHFYIKMLLLRLCFFALTLIFALAFIYIKNVAMLLIMILTMFIFLATINVAFASGEEREYEIVEVKSNQSKN